MALRKEPLYPRPERKVKISQIGAAFTLEVLNSYIERKGGKQLSKEQYNKLRN